MKTRNTLRNAWSVALMSTAFATGALASVGYSNRPEQTPAQAKNFDWVNEAGSLRCQPKGKLSELLNDPYKCYLNLDECKASVDTLKGTIDPGFLELFTDMAAIDPKGDKANFVNSCPSDNGPEFVYLLAIRGLGYTRDAKYAPALTRIVEGPRAAKVGNGLRTAVAEAVAFMGDKAALETASKDLLPVKSMDPEYKRVLLQSLARVKSDVGVEFCTGALTNDDDKKVREDCIFYLGQRHAKGAIPLLQRGLEKYEATTMHAYGQMGDKSLLKDVQAYLDDKDGQPYRTRLPAVVAAVNLGDAKALVELQTWLSGKRPVSKKDQERAAKSKSKAKKGAKADDSFDAEFVQGAAMESILLTDAKAIAEVKRALTAAADNKDDKKWKAYVYATIALAQLGDAKGTAKLVEIFNSPKEDIRNAVINAVGGREMHTGEYFMLTGYGYVANKEVATALEKYLATEGKKENIVRAVTALGMTRSALVGK